MNTTIDNYLLTLAKRGFDNLSDIPSRDIKVLNSLSRQLNSNVFLTENQARLLLKILNENKTQLPEMPEAVTWSQDFRQLDQIRTIGWSKSENSILIELSFSKRVKQLITDMKTNIEGNLYSDTSGKRFKIDLTEKNLHTVISTLRGESFDIDSELLDYFNEINKILSERATALEDINSKVIGLVSDKVDFSDPLIVADRRTRYQYSAPDATGDSLAAKLANRKHRKVFANPTTINFDTLVESLVELDRKKILVVLDSFDANRSLHAVEELQSALEILEGEARQVGVYFRFDNHSNSNKEFNEFIKSRRLNAPLTKTTFIAGIASNQIPKFIFKEGWYPDTVISFVTNMHNNKVSAFCDSVDMIVYYTNNKPIHSSGEIDEIV